MKEVIVIKTLLYNVGNSYVSSYTEDDVMIDQAENAKHFSTKQDAEDYLEKFPNLSEKEGSKYNAYSIETIFIIE